MYVLYNHILIKIHTNYDEITLDSIDCMVVSLYFLSIQEQAVV